jgi:predicted DNA-binding protein (MmcQ/YjbR family)
VVTPQKIVEKLRKAALALPYVEEGVACAGTVLESATFKIKKKTFLFVSEKHARLRLRKSAPEAQKLAKQEPQRYVIGPQGWAKIFLAEDPPLDLLLEWLEESYRLYVQSK